MRAPPGGDPRGRGADARQGRVSLFGPKPMLAVPAPVRLGARRRRLDWRSSVRRFRTAHHGPACRLCCLPYHISLVPRRRRDTRYDRGAPPRGAAAAAASLSLSSSLAAAAGHDESAAYALADAAGGRGISIASIPIHDARQPSPVQRARRRRRGDLYQRRLRQFLGDRGRLRRRRGRRRGRRRSAPRAMRPPAPPPHRPRAPRPAPPTGHRS